MAILTKDGKYRCFYCGKEFSRPQEADNCRDGHNLIYIAVSAEDLMRLKQFIVTGERALLTESLIKAISSKRR